MTTTDERKFIFVGGCMRSGTTIVQRLLCSSPVTNPILSECYYLAEQLGLYMKSRSTFEMRSREYFSNVEGLTAFTREIVDRFLSLTLSNCAPAKTLVLKNPELTRYFPLLASWYPHALFVVTVRDPRDTVTSILNVADQHRKDGVTSSITRMGRDMALLSRFYKSYYRPVLSHLKEMKDQVIMVRYEGFVKETDEVVAAVSRFCDIPLRHQDMADEKAWGGETPYFDDQKRSGHKFFDAFWSPLYNKALSESRIGRYKDYLAGDEIAAIERHCADFNRIIPYW